MAGHNRVSDIFQLASQLRVDAIRCTTRAGSGHPTSGLSAADLVAILLARHLRYDVSRPGDPRNDHLIFSKGHASSLLYAALKAVGAIDDDELLTYRGAGSRLQGHPTPALPWVDVATGSLGQGLPVGVGVALAVAVVGASSHVWVLCGDGELGEGSMWEALHVAGERKLAGLTAIVDVNGLGQTGPTALRGDLGQLAARVEAFGCRSLSVDGHDLETIDAALASAREDAVPTVVLARTVKGHGVPEVADRVEWHGKALPSELAERAIDRLGGLRTVRVTPPAPPPAPAPLPEARPPEWVPHYRFGDKVATRDAFGAALATFGARRDLVVIDGDVCTATRVAGFAAADPSRFLQMRIAEQQMVATAMGCAVRGLRPLLATFGAFLTRAHDQLRMAAISGLPISVVGSHAGSEIGRDGPSQMALEDLALFRALRGSTVLYPSDATSTVRLLEATLESDGIGYLRTTRGAYPVLYGPEENFQPGGAKVLVDAGSDFALIGAGVTVHHCLDAARRLERDGLRGKVVDLYSVKPIAANLLMDVATEVGGRLIVVEDHYPEGGIASAVAEALLPLGLRLRVAHLAVRELPASASASQAMAAAGIDPAAVHAAALVMLRQAEL